jgi:hypothetical protein
VKKLISCALLFVIIFNLTACFDTDDLFDNVIAPEGSVPENTEKSTTISPTEKPTEETEPVIEDATSNVGEKKEVYFAAQQTLSNTTVSEEMISDISLIIDIDKDDDYDIYNTNTGIADTNNGIKAAYLSCSSVTGNFGEAYNIGDGSLVNLCKEFYVVDGSEVSADKASSVFVVSRLHSSILLSSVSFLSFENGKLSLEIKYATMLNTDDGIPTCYMIIELDKAVVNGDITEIETSYGFQTFNLFVTNHKTDNSQMLLPHWWGMREEYKLHAILGQKAAWSSSVDPTIEFDYTVEIVNTNQIGEDVYSPTYELTDEKRVIKYNSELGICVEGNRSLQLTDSENEYFKSIVSQVN